MGLRFQVQANQWAICSGHSDMGTDFLGAFAKFRKATISFVMSVRPHT